MKNIKKVLAIYDSHYPDNLNFTPFFNFAKDYRPDEFVLGGDNWSLDIISHWNDADFKNIGFDNIQRKLKEEASGFTKQLEDFRLAMSKANFTYIVGNHEHWLKEFTQKYPQMNDLSLQSLLPLKKLKVRLIPFGGYYQIGKIYFKHGHEYGTENPAKQAVTRAHHTMVIGHHHSYKVWTEYSDVVAEERHVGVLVPCYCHRAPDYQKGRPNAWLNGFFYATVKPSGKYCLGIQNVSPKGEFIDQSGKEWDD